MTTDEKKTLEMLEWAKNTASENETGAMFWNELCNAVRESHTALPSRVLSKLKLYGGNSIANTLRGEGVAYSEIAYDVAKTLKPFFKGKRFSKSNVESCETYILEKMEVKEDDISKICEAMKEKGMKNAVNAQVRKTAEKAVAESAAIAASRQAAKAVAKRAMAEASKKVAQEAAKQVARQVFIRIMAALNIILAVVTVIDVAGPARRVIIPGVTYVALLRRLYQQTIRGL